MAAQQRQPYPLHLCFLCPPSSQEEQDGRNSCHYRGLKQAIIHVYAYVLDIDK